MHVAPGIHHFETYLFNWYVIEKDSRLKLVDAGFPGHYELFLAELRLIGRELRDVDAVVLTQIQADNTGFAERVRRELNVPVYRRTDAEFVSDFGRGADFSNALPSTKD